MAAADRIYVSCSADRLKYQPTPSKRRVKILRRDVRALARAFEREPDKKFAPVDESDPGHFTLREIISETALTVENNGACEPLGRPLRAALARQRK